MHRLRRGGVSAPIIAAFMLTGCGGGRGPAASPATYTVGGIVSGLVGSGLTLKDSAAGALIVSANGEFTLPDKLPSGAAYAVVIAQQPSNPVQNCVLTGGSGEIDDANASVLSVICGKPSYPIGVVLSGLLGSSITIENNGGDTRFPLRASDR